MSIKVQGLTKIFGEQTAVDHVSFEIGSGSIVGFLGPNGAGKSTTMKMIATYLPPNEGTAWVNGLNIQEEPLEVKKHIGYLQENNPLYYDMYVREYLGFVANIHQIPDKNKRIEEMIDMTGLRKEAGKKIGALSKGYKQRVGLAQAMIHNPEVLILDEPTTGLDPNQIIEIRELIIRLGKEKTVLLSTHIMQEVQAMCSRVLIINNGTLVEDKAIEDIGLDVDTQILIVDFTAPVEGQELERLEGVRVAKSLDNNRRWALQADDADAARKALMQWSIAANKTIESLQSKKQTLEEVFREVTKG